MLQLLLLALAAAPTSSSIPLPGGPPVSVDYLAYDAVRDRVWVPAGNTGNVDVIDPKTGKVTAVEGFAATTVKGRDGRERVIGPSAAAVGDDFVYVGDRARAQVCAIEARSLEKKGVHACALDRVGHRVDRHGRVAERGEMQRVLAGAASGVEHVSLDHTLFGKTHERLLRPADVPWGVP